MIYFLYGQDSYRSKRKLEEIILGYKKIHKSGLNLIHIDAKEKSFNDFYNELKVTSMFSEKKLIILKNVFDDAKFQKEFLEGIKNLEDIKDIIVVYEDYSPDQRTKLFKALTKNVPTAKPSRTHDPQQVGVGTKCQGFDFLQPAMLKKWVVQEFDKNRIKISPDALDLLVSFVKNDLWKMASEINKLSSYKMAGAIKKEDVELLVKPDIENDIFKTIDALASKDKKQALSLLHKHLENGDSPLYLLSMISYQFRNLLVIKELQDDPRGTPKPYGFVIKNSGLHPFVAQKSYYLCNQFTSEKLKKIYRKIFQIDTDIKTGKIEPETALDLLLSEI